MVVNLVVFLVLIEFLCVLWVECVCFLFVIELDDGDELGLFFGVFICVVRWFWLDSLFYDLDFFLSFFFFVSLVEVDWFGYFFWIFIIFGVLFICRGRIWVIELCVWYILEVIIVGCCDLILLEIIEFVEFLGVINYLGIIIVCFEIVNLLLVVFFCFLICFVKYEIVL